MRLLLALAIVVLATPAVAEHAGKAWLCRNAPKWQMCRVPVPHAKPAEIAPAPAIEPASPIVSPPSVPAIVPTTPHETAPARTPRATHVPVERVRPKQIEREKHKPTVQAKPRSSYPCGQIGLGISIFGVDGMKSKARERGYSERQISEAQRACGY